MGFLMFAAMQRFPLVCLIAALSACGSSSFSPPGNVTGAWTGQMDNNSSQTYQMYLTQAGTQLTGQATYIVVESDTPTYSASNIVETVPVTGTLHGDVITLSGTCESCSAFVELSGHFVNSRTVHATLTGGTPSGAATFQFLGQVEFP
jgi:hypothetical protein